MFLTFYSVFVQAEVIKQKFNWYISGLGYKSIAKKLNEFGDLVNQKSY